MRRIGLISVLIVLVVACITERETDGSGTKERVAEPTPAATVTDDELCSWICGSCFGPAAGLQPYPGDCHSACKNSIATEPCDGPTRGAYLCQYRNKDCQACRAEHQAIEQCLANCSELNRQNNYDETKLPEHCKVKTVQN